MAQLAAERSEAAAAAKRGLEDNVRLEKQLVDARRKVHTLEYGRISCRCSFLFAVSCRLRLDGVVAAGGAYQGRMLPVG